jgi:DNA invertase Pin-like site-specific DNA recombinase
MDVGYARVSTGEQTLDLQLDALAKAGCGRVFEETASGAKADRVVLAEVLAYLRAGDTLVVWRLDRLGRSLGHLIATVAELAGRGVGFRSLTERIDTTTSGGKLVFHVFGALAEFERDLVRLGQIVGTPGAFAAMERGGHVPPEFLLRHKRGDWGALDEEDRAENERAVRDGSRSLSAYSTRLDERLWVITEWDRSATTLLLPSEY